MSKQFEELVRHEVLLSQRLGAQRSYLQDYALNVNYEKLVRLRIISKILNIRNRRLIRELEHMILESGEAAGIQKLDVISQLGIKVGYTRKRVVL